MADAEFADSASAMRNKHSQHLKDKEKAQ